MEASRVGSWMVGSWMRVAAVCAALGTGGCAGTEGLPVSDLLQMAGLESSAGLDDATIASGLKEALRVGTDRTVASTSKLDGFLANQLIRIALPDEFEKTARGLRAIGLGSQVDELEVSMNRAAEQAAAEAAPIFVDAITQMSFADARAILSGPQNAATQYFKDKTSGALRQRFTPIVDASMDQVGLARLYDGIVAQVAQLPLVPKPNLDLREYVTDRALSGLFTVLEGEEARIREDPAARSTALLKQVFGGV